MGTSPFVGGVAPIHSFYSSKSWIDGAATRQLQQVALLPGVRAVAAMPDLHPGKYGPVGCGILADAIHPALIGADIGCGMGLYAIDLPARKIRIDKAPERLRSIECPFDGDIAGELATAGLYASAFDHTLGTIGGGNHFCELQVIEEIFAPDTAAAAGLDQNAAYILAHSGSRGLGHAILDGQLGAGLRPLDPLSDAGRRYMRHHDDALLWARVNRRVIAERAARALRCSARLICDCSHNFAQPRCDGVLHRKGAAPSDMGLVPVPGSRGALSYLVEPLGDAAGQALCCLAHGAGRKYDRASMAGRVGTSKSDREKLAQNPFGGRVICEDRELLIEEAPQAYKSIDRVIGDLVEFGLARVVATFRPLVTLKRVAEPESQKRQEGWR
jgi:release factor H-coupled RctB family protein